MKKLLFLIAMLWGVAYGQSKIYLRGDSVQMEKSGGNSELILLNSTRAVTGGVLTNTGNGRTAFVTPSAGGGSTLASEGTTKRGDTVVVVATRKIYYITQPTTGSALTGEYAAISSPGYTVVNGQWVFTGGANNRTQYIRSTRGVLAEGAYIEGYVICNTIGATDQGPALTFKSYNSLGYAHDVELRFVTGASATNGNKLVIFGSTGASTNVSDSARLVSNGDTLYYKLKRTGLAYQGYIENLTKDWKLQKYVQTTPGGSPFVAHNSANIAVIPGAGSYTVYGVRYVIDAPLQTKLMIVGNSITMRQGATTEGGGFASLVGNPALNIGSGGGADVSASILARVQEIIAINPEAVLLADPAGNDILFGISAATWKANLLAVRDSLVAHGITVYWAFFPRTLTDVSEQKIYVDTTTTFRSDIKINTWDALLGSGTSLLAKYDLDGTHPNDAGHAQIASTTNVTLHYSNGDAQYVAKNLIARNGYLFANDAGTGPDQNKSGAWIAALTGSLTQYMHGGFYVDYGWINAISEGSAYRDIGISTAGTAKFFVGSSTNRTAKLNVTDPTAGTTEIMAAKHSGSYSAIGQQSQFAWYNGTSTKTGMFTNTVGTGSMFNLDFYTYNGGMQTTPALSILGDNKIKMINIPFIAGKDTVMYWDASDSMLKRTLIVGGAGGITALTGDVTASGSGSVAATLATVNSNVGSFTSANITVNAKGLITAASNGSGGSGSPAGNFGNVQLNRNGVFDTPATDSLIYTAAAGLVAKNFISSSTSYVSGRTTGASSGFKTGAIVALGSSGTASYLQFGYDATLAAGWFQSVTEGSAYRDLIMNAAGGNLGLGALTALPTTLLHLKKVNYPAIRLEKTGTNSWYVGNRTESTGTTFSISYSTTDWQNTLITGQTGFGGNASPTAWVHPAAGTTTIAPVKLTSGTNLTTAEAGAIEYNGTSFFMSPSTTRLRAVLTNNAIPSSGQVPYGNGTDFTLGDHGNIAGLSDDDHTQYALLAGRSGGQTLIGGTAANEGLILQNNSLGSGNSDAGIAISLKGGNSKGVFFDMRNDGVIEFKSGVAHAVASITTNTTITPQYHINLADATSGNITITLPPVSDCQFVEFVFKKIDGTANTVTIDGNASQTIDGTTTKVITTQYEGFKIVNDGISAWFIISTF